MSRNRAEYMRAYRARKLTPPSEPRLSPERVVAASDRYQRIVDLEEEVRRLKRLLAEKSPLRVTPLLAPREEGFGRGLSQVERDAILRKIQSKPDCRL